MQSVEADRKVVRQDEIVARMSGASAGFPQETHLLIEMKLNQAAIDVNRALFEYGFHGPAIAARARGFRKKP